MKITRQDSRRSGPETNTGSGHGETKICFKVIHLYDEIKSSLNSWNVCYYSVQTVLSSCLISKNLNIKIYKTVILPDVLYGCETWSVTLGGEYRLKVFENRVLRKTFGPKREEGHGENCIMMNFITCILHRILLG